MLVTNAHELFVWPSGSGRAFDLALLATTGTYL